MLAPSLASLEAALARDDLDGWLAQVPEALRERLRRAIAIDQRLRAEHPASLASCLLARTFGSPDFDELQQAWAAELDERGEPWVRPLRGLPVAPGLLAELHEGAELDLRELTRPSFEADAEIVLVPYRFHATVQAPEKRRRDRLFWSWARGEARLEPDPRADQPERRELYPRVETKGWGPAFLA
ncbi:MAG: hypothetical protein MUF34_16260, partial [Polyangiaceae bacterium]|nr:hypothetical protein [Polyangiaceae bacterium]